MPMTPETLSRPRIASELNRSSTRSAMLAEKSRVRSDRGPHVDAAQPGQQAGLVDQVARAP
jgi:hypothetical protein